MDERTRLLEGLTTARQMMRQVLPRMDVEHEIYPGWRMKELLAHITGWDEVVIGAVQAYSQGQPTTMLTQSSIDECNADFVAARAGMTFEQVVEEMEQARGELTQAAQSVSEFSGRIAFPWGGTGTITRMVDIIIDHEIEHAEELEELIEKSK